jgi:two-component system copper resistance phosphate regulon response regulator CusR
MKVLVVDDDAAVRASVTKVLKAEGYETLAAADGQEALAQFASQKIDLLLLDLGLPIKSGWAAFERITSEDPFLPVIIITGQPEQRDVAIAAGVGALMEKPLDALQLLYTIRELLTEPKEVRLHRLCGHGGQVRHIPASNTQFLKQLREQYEKPIRFNPPRGCKFPS